MIKEKKGISCSYAVLVIILFAALAFVTDYAFIQNKMHKCPNNVNVVKQNGESSGSVGDDATGVEENGTNTGVMENQNNSSTQIDSNASKTDYVQKYLQYINYSSNGEELRSFEIILNLDGTAEWNVVGANSDSSKLVGYYRFISNDKMVLALFDKDYLINYQCNDELNGTCQTALILDYDSYNNNYKANNITYSEVQKTDLRSLSE